MSKKKQNIEIEIRFEEGNSTRDEQLLSLVKFLRALTDGEIEPLISINGCKTPVCFMISNRKFES